MQNEPQWLSVETVIEINRAVFLLTGEPHFLRARGLLESALARPQNALAYGEEDLVALASGCWLELPSHMHSLKDFVAMVQFLNANDYNLAIEDSAAWADTIIALVEHRTTEEDFVRTIRPFVTER